MRASVSNKFLVDSNGQSWPCPISRARAPRAPMKRWNLRTADSVSSPVNRHRRSSKRTSMAWRKRISSGGERPAGSFKRCRWPTVGASVRSQLMKIRTTSRPGVTFRRAAYPINPKRSTSQDSLRRPTALNSPSHASESAPRRPRKTFISFTVCKSPLSRPRAIPSS